jgi:hypothetical protein
MCVTNTCATGCCGTMNANSGHTCSDNNGKVCDGNGKCVACLMASDCAAQTTVCKTNTCTSHTCGTMPAQQGMACEGTNHVCDGNGNCVSMHCMDGVKDADETDVDCGGASCAPCGDGKKCLHGTDCVNKVCTGADGGTEGLCALPSCSDGQQNGNETDVDCGGTAYMEAPDAGIADAGPFAACSPCANGKKCAVPADCTSQECTSMTCSTLAAGAACTADVQCTSGVCGVSHTGHCCTAACSPTVAACGATDCDTSGACAYPGSTVAPAALQTPGDCQKVVCDGSGGKMSVDDPTDLPTSNSACLINPACCGSPAAPCFTNAPTGTACTLASDPAAQVCGNTSNSTIAGTCVECNTSSDCLAINDAGTLTCNTTTNPGICQ